VEQTEQRNEFFEELKRTRESKGLRLEDIARRYRIRLSFLESIESGTFEDLPEPIYTKTFIKTYAGLLGVDAGPLLAQYAKHVEKTLPPAPPEVQAARESVGAGAGKALMAWAGSMGSKAVWAVLALAVLLILGVYALQDKPEKPVPAKTAAREEVKPPEKPAEVKPPEESSAQPAQPQQPEAAPPQPQQQAAAPEPKKPEAPPPPAEKKEPVPSPPPAAGTLSLTIEATEAAWVQVKADRTPAIQRLLQAGERVNTEAKEKITVDLGNAGGVQITFQGQSLGSPGKRGEVVHLVYPEGKRVERKKPEEPKPAAAAETKPAAE
jgi:cytoskeletal protein RodZ